MAGSAETRGAFSSPFLAPFLDGNFDAEAFVRSVLRDDAQGRSSTEFGAQSAAEQTAEAVQRAIAHVEKELQELVYANEGQLIQHAKQTSGLAERTASLHLRARSLQTLTNRAKADVLAPAEALQRDTVAFERAIEAGESVKAIQTLHTVVRKAQLLWESAGDGAEAAAQRAVAVAAGLAPPPPLHLVRPPSPPGWPAWGGRTPAPSPASPPSSPTHRPCSQTPGCRVCTSWMRTASQWQT